MKKDKMKWETARKRLFQAVALVLCCAILAGEISVYPSTVSAASDKEQVIYVRGNVFEGYCVKTNQVKKKSYKSSFYVYAKHKDWDSLDGDTCEKLEAEGISENGSTCADISFKVLTGKKYISIKKSFSKDKGWYDCSLTLKKGTPVGEYKIKVTAKAINGYKEVSRTLTLPVVSSSYEKKLSIPMVQESNFAGQDVVCFDAKKAGTVTLTYQFSDNKKYYINKAALLKKYRTSYGEYLYDYKNATYMYQSKNKKVNSFTMKMKVKKGENYIGIDIRHLDADGNDNQVKNMKGDRKIELKSSSAIIKYYVAYNAWG